MAGDQDTKRELGYTLTETLIVLVILSLTISISAPAVKAMFPKVSLNASADQLRADLGHARRTAMWDSQIFDVTVSTNGTEYFIKSTQKTLRDRRLPNGMRVEANLCFGSSDLASPTLRIHPDGTFEGCPLSLIHDDKRVDVDFSRSNRSVVIYP